MSITTIKDCRLPKQVRQPYTLFFQLAFEFVCNGMRFLNLTRPFLLSIFPATGNAGTPDLDDGWVIVEDYTHVKPVRLNGHLCTRVTESSSS